MSADRDFLRPAPPPRRRRRGPLPRIGPGADYARARLRARARERLTRWSVVLAVVGAVFVAGHLIGRHGVGALVADIRTAGEAAVTTLSAPPPPQVLSTLPARPEPPVDKPSLDLLAALPVPDPPPDPPWRQHRVAIADPGDRPLIAVVIDDLGLNQTATRRTIALPGPLTLAFISYGEQLQTLADAARDAGHERLVHVPMEPMRSDIDTGPNALRVAQSAEENLAHLDWALSRFEGYVGFNNHMGSRFTSTRAALAPILDEAQRRGLLFLDSRTSIDTEGAALAEAIGLPHAVNQVFIDHEIDALAIRGMLDRIERLARSRGQIVAIGHPHTATLEALEAWLPTLADKGFALVPISTIVERLLPAPPDGGVPQVASGVPG